MMVIGEEDDEEDNNDVCHVDDGIVLHLLSQVVPSRVGVLVGHESGDCPEHDGDHKEGEQDAEAYSLATVRFLTRTEVALLKYLYLMKSTLS